MKNQAILPTPGGVLRALITASGYRPLFENAGLDKDLDDQATENRQGKNFDLLERCREQWISAIREDAGVEWSILAESAWNRHSILLRSLARNTDTTSLLSERARPVVLKLLVITEISGAIRRASQELPLLDMNQWWDAPFYYWLKAASLQSRTPEKQLLERLANYLDVDDRSLDRWLKGASIGKGLWPYRETLKALFAGSNLTERQIERLTGWLIMVVALQSLSAELRDSVKHDFFMHRQQSLKTEQQFIACLKAEAADRQCLVEREQVAPVLNDLDNLFTDAVNNQHLIRDRLDWLRALCERGSATTRAAHEYLWLGLSARLAANLGEKEPALKLYAAACQTAWWRAGPHQHVFIHEALCYAIGVGDQIQATISGTGAFCWV